MADEVTVDATDTGDAVLNDADQQSLGEPNPIEQATAAVTSALEGLGVVLTDEALFNTLSELNNPLQEEIDAKAAEARALRASHEQLKPRVQAQARILANEIDKALAEGRDADVAAKRMEYTKLEGNLRHILTQASTCDARVQELAEEQRRNYRRIATETYPSIRQSTAAVAIGVAKLLDSVWDDGLLQFEIESGIPNLLRSQHKLDLTPYDFGSEKPWFQKLQRWFGGRR